MVCGFDWFVVYRFLGLIVWLVRLLVGWHGATVDLL